jgi:hypothetical protein
MVVSNVLSASIIIIIIIHPDILRDKNFHTRRREYLKSHHKVTSFY